MKLSCLKPLRVLTAVAFFIPVVLLFLDFRDMGVRSLAGELLFLQFIPSALKFLNHAALGAAGFIVILIITLIFGRIYCAALCPLGVFQDMISRLFPKTAPPGGKKNRQKRYVFSQPHTILRYSVLSLTLLLFFTGFNLVFNLLDPFSSFGRIFSNLFRPFVITLNNLVTPLAESLGSLALYRVQWPIAAPVSLGIAVVTLGTIGWLSARHGRLYCNTICPVGTLLGLVSKISLFRIDVAADACKSCRQCEYVCKAGCIDAINKKVDTSRCVSCFNCLSVCPDQAVNFHLKGPKIPRQQTESSRRNFMFTIAAGSLGMAAKKVYAEPVPPPLQSRPTTIPENKTCPLSPPGSKSIDRYTAICTACHLCVSACPSRLLVPSVFSFGISGMTQPQMDFTAGHCNYDCTVCSNVCPSGAILPLTIKEKQHTQVGVAKFIKESCVVYTDNTNCGACSEHCPTKAVHMVPYLNASGRKLVIPKMNEAICVGCGGCEHACPTKPFKAIYVDGNPVHKIAQKPRQKKLEPTIMDTEEDFPF